MEVRGCAARRDTPRLPFSYRLRPITTKGTSYMQIRSHSLQHSAVKLLLLCPALLSSGWLYTWYAYGEVTLLSTVGFWPILLYVLTSNMTLVAIPLLGGSAALVFLYLRARSLRRITLLLILLSLWLFLLPWVMQACFWTIYYFRN